MTICKATQKNALSGLSNLQGERCDAFMRIPRKIYKEMSYQLAKIFKLNEQMRFLQKMVNNIYNCLLLRRGDVK